MDIRDISPIIADVAKNYRYHKPPQALIFFQNLLEKMKRLLLDFLSQFHLLSPDTQSNTSAVGNLLQVILVIAGVLAIILLIYFVWRRMTLLNAQALLAKRGQV